MRINELATKSGNMNSSDYFAVDRSSRGVTDKVAYTELAKQIVSQYSSLQLAGSLQTVKSAIDGLNTKVGKLKFEVSQEFSAGILTWGIANGAHMIVIVMAASGDVAISALVRNNAEHFETEIVSSANISISASDGYIYVGNNTNRPMRAYFFTLNGG